jgi:hypothetical protein
MENVDVKKVIKICEKLGLTKKSRKREIVYQRYAAFNFLRKNTGMSLMGIGECFNQDHCTVMHGLKTYDLYTQINDKLFLWSIKEVETLLNDYENVRLLRFTRPLPSIKRVNYFRAKMMLKTEKTLLKIYDYEDNN